jgi:oxalate decarboxylase
MSDPQRREFLVTAAGIAALATLSGSQAALAGDPSFMNNVPDPDLSGKELPTFKFALEKSEGKVIGNSFGKEATVSQLPISKGIAGVSMKLEPGAMRELHWHATAAEWALVLEGRVRTTMIDPSGFAETNDFDPGDVWYFPRGRGHGHMLQCLGEKPCHFILIFDNGYFSEFGTFSITDWVGHTPKPLLAKTFGLPEAAFDNFPREEVYFARGKPPPAEPSVPLQGWKLPPETHKYRLLAQRPHATFAGGREWRSGFQPLPDRENHHRRGPRSRSRRLAHAALASERRRMAIRHRRHGQRHLVRPARPLQDRAIAAGGDVGYIPQGYGHSIENIGDKPARILIGFNSGLYETIDLSQWIAGNPLDVLATNFSQPAELFEKFPHQDVFIANGSGGGK